MIVGWIWWRRARPKLSWVGVEYSVRMLKKVLIQANEEGVGGGGRERERTGKEEPDETMLM